MGSTAFGAVTGGGAGAAFGAAGAVAPVRNLKFGALNFDDSRTMGDRSGPINKAKGYQATAEDMSGENLEAIQTRWHQRRRSQKLKEHLLVEVKLMQLFVTQKHCKTHYALNQVSK